MKLQYPFEPKSNRFLIPGQYWAIPLESGRYACGRVLDVPPGEMRKTDTKTFFAGLMDWSGNEVPTFDSLRGCTVLEQGNAHIKTIINNGKLILGFRALEEDNIILPLQVTSEFPAMGTYLMQGYKEVRLSIPEDYRIYSVQHGWGYGVIKLLAEKYFGK